jgi:hypothetical protein
MQSHAKFIVKCLKTMKVQLKIAKVPKMRPRTKHLNIKYHHFREEVSKGTVSIYHVKTEDQMADMLTKPLDQKLFEAHREKMMGW